MVNSFAFKQCDHIDFSLFQYLKEIKDPMMEGVLLETENMLARGRMDLPLTLCFAALRGDDLLLHHLLKRGLDPNESDNNGRTALVSIYTRPSFEIGQPFITVSDSLSWSIFIQHIAASKGNDNCVLVLLDFGADANSRGKFNLTVFA